MSSGVHSGGSKDVQRVIGISPEQPWQSGSLRMSICSDSRLLNHTKGDLFATLTGEAGFVLRNTPPAG